MESISHAVLTADTIKQFIHAEIKATDNKVKNEREATESKNAKSKALAALHSTVALVDGTLANLTATKRPSSSVKTARVPNVSKRTIVPRAFGAMGTPQDTANDLKVAMSADPKNGLGSQVSSLNDMAKAIQPIISNFDSVLEKPYLNQFSATLNTVPVVGVKNNQLMYIAKQPDVTSKSGTKDVWTYFCALPDGVTVDATTNVHIFPYKGDFCLSVGTAVWRKRHRTQDDPVLKQAVDNWPKMYLDDWEKIGDSAFPSDVRDVIPFAVLSSDRTTIDFKLLILNQNSSIQLLSKDDIYPSNDWTNLAYQKKTNDPAQLPVWIRTAYWNNSIVALDDQNNTWALTMNWDNGNYTIDDKTQIDATTEFTATDIGPVSVHSDGYLYQRYVQEPPGDGQDPTLQWTRWILQDGVTKLGVAAPGVILDLQTLTRTLKARYIDTQTALYPVVNKINAFAVTHNSYLGLLMQAATDWSNADSDQKQADAITAGKGFVTHAKVWAGILNQSILNNKNTVNIMTAQLHDVKTQLAVQLQLLRDKLTGLQNTLKTQQEALDKLQAAFWGAVAAMLLGMALGVIALASGVGAFAVVGAGALFVAGFVAMVALSVKISDLSAEISDTQSQINVTNTAINELSAVVANFTDLDTLYGTLNVFWGRMWNDSSSLMTMDDATADQLGTDLLADPSSIIAAQQVTGQIAAAATLYLDTLNKQGIVIQPPSLMATSFAASPHLSKLASLVPIPTAEETEHQVARHIANAQSDIKRGYLGGYQESMEKALVAAFASNAVVDNTTLYSGNWYDIALLSNSAGIINSTILQNESSKYAGSGSDQIKAQATGVTNQVNTATPAVVGMLQKTTAMCSSIQDLLDKYKAYSQAGDDKSIAALKDSLLQTALNECTSAQSLASQANNAFVDANHACQEYQQNLQSNINQLGDSASAAKARADSDIRNIDIPWYVYLAGPIAVVAYRQNEVNNITDNLNAALATIDMNIQQLQAALQSGASLNGQALNWADMAQAVSKSLAGIYNILSAVSGQVLEDPSLYDSLLSIEWANIAKNAQEVLNILASRGVSSSSSTVSAVSFNALPSKVATGLFVKGNGINGSGVNGTALRDAVDNSKAVQALESPSNLGTTIGQQAKQAQDIFSSMDTLLQLPYLSGMVGFWSGDQTQKESLLDVVTNLRRQYVDMMSTEYPVIEGLFTTSLLQATRAQLVQNGTITPTVLVTSSLKSARAWQKVAEAASTKFNATTADYQAALKQIEANLTDIQTKLDAVNKQIGDLEKQERDKIIWLIADIVALSLATAVLLASLPAFGAVAGALTTAGAIGLGATATAAGVKVAVDSLGLHDIETLLDLLRGTQRDLQTTLITLQAVEPLLANVTSGAEAVQGAMDSMSTELEALVNDIGLMKNLGLTDADVAAIGKSWQDVNTNCTAWLDAVNAQGIVPSS